MHLESRIVSQIQLDDANERRVSRPSDPGMAGAGIVSQEHEMKRPLSRILDTKKLNESSSKDLKAEDM